MASIYLRGGLRLRWPNCARRLFNLNLLKKQLEKGKKRGKGEKMKKGGFPLIIQVQKKNLPAHDAKRQLMTDDLGQAL